MIATRNTARTQEALTVTVHLSMDAFINTTNWNLLSLSMTIPHN